MMGGGFQHDICSVANNVPKNIKWDKTNFEGDISIHIDLAIFNIKPNKNKINFAWMCESPFYTRQFENEFDNPIVKKHMFENFKYIFSCNKKFIERHPEVKYVIPTACPWVVDRQVFPKSKLVSIIASNKREAPGHVLRHIIVDTYKGHVDVFGKGYVSIESKNLGLNNYMFSYTIENSKDNGYFTEKIADCFATGTIPVYWGDETISDYFVEDGIIRLNDDFDPSMLTIELYQSKLTSVMENYQRVINFPCPEDYIYSNYV